MIYYGVLLLCACATVGASVLYSVLFVLTHSERDLHIATSCAGLTLLIVVVWGVLQPWLELLP